MVPVPTFPASRDAKIWSCKKCRSLQKVHSSDDGISLPLAMGGGGKEKSIYVHTNDCTICRRLSKNVVAAFTWNRNLESRKQSIPLNRCRTFPVLCPKFVVGAHGNDLLEVDSTQVLSSPSVRQVNLQCKKQISSIEPYTSVTKKKFHWHGPSDPHADSTRAKYHAIALTNSCLVQAPQCDE